MVKHWHQFWHWIVISVFCFGITNWPWILPQFTSLCRKLALVFLFWWIWVFWKKNFFQPSFTKKITFYIQTKSFWVRIVIPKFQELHFCFSDLFPNHEFSDWTFKSVFFSHEKKRKKIVVKNFFWFFYSKFCNFANLLRPKFWSEWRPLRW